MRVLFTSAGRRGYLLDWFRNSGHFGQLVAVNSEPCVAFAHSDAWGIVPQASSQEFEASILEIIERYAIDLVFALSDADSFVLSRFKGELQARGVYFVGPDHDSVRLMLDKLNWSKTLRESGFPTLRTLDSPDEVATFVESGAMSFPIIMKPRVGTSSRLNTIVSDTEQLFAKHEQVMREESPSFLEASLGIAESQRLIFQELTLGTEFGVDLLSDLSGNFEGSFVRRKLQMRDGETYRAKTIRDFSAGFDFEKLARGIGAMGLIDVDLMMRSDGSSVILDLNPRIGGGYPFSHVAGADLPTFVSQWARGQRISFDFGGIREIEVGKGVSVVEIPTGAN